MTAPQPQPKHTIEEVRKHKAKKDLAAHKRVLELLPRNVVREAQASALRQRQAKPRKPRAFVWSPKPEEPPE